MTSYTAWSRNEVIGIVRDSVTLDNLEYVNVFSIQAKKGVMTDEKGIFKITAPVGSSIRISSMGYEEKNIRIANIRDTLSVYLTPRTYDLSELTVRPHKEKYSKHNNPAVDLIEQVRKDYPKVSPFETTSYNYEGYSKTVLGINDYKGEGSMANYTGRKLRFLNNYIDTAAWTGKPVLDLSLKEKVFHRIHKDSKGNTVEITDAILESGIDESFNMDNVRVILEDMLREIDPYSNDVYVLQNKFVSPLSAIGPDFYKYFITDTVNIGKDRCVELSFVPKSPETFSFVGKVYIPVGDGPRYVRRISMRIPSAINLNYARNIFVNQNFSLDASGKLHKIMDDINIELQLIPGTPELYASRKTRYRNFTYDVGDDILPYLSMLGPRFDMVGYDTRNETFWEQHRQLELSRAEKAMNGMMRDFRKLPLLYWGEKVLKVLVNGYIRTGKESKFDIGPVNTLISYNAVEGLRLRLGGKTTAYLNPRFFVRGYGAYGCRDHKWKYSAEAEYSFINKKYHSLEFPSNGINAKIQYDLDHIGEHYLFTNSDNVFLSLKRKQSELAIYRRLYQLEYNLELRNNFSVNAGYRHETQYATPWVEFIDVNGFKVPKYHEGVFRVSLRYAPGERFIQSAERRSPINMDAPVFTVTHEYGPKGVLGSDFSFNKTEVSFRKRFWFSAFGYANVILKGGKIWSSVPFPALLWQNANLSYTIQPESYSLLNPMEFAMDCYGGWDIEYYMNGLLFNRIPLIKKAKLREILGFKGFAGHLSKKNNPEYNSGLFRFPVDSHTLPMEKTPYMEISAGIDNIFTILRVDYVCRLTYRNQPGIDKSGLRISLHFSF